MKTVSVKVVRRWFITAFSAICCWHKNCWPIYLCKNDWWWTFP